MQCASSTTTRLTRQPAMSWRSEPSSRDLEREPLESALWRMREIDASLPWSRQLLQGCCPHCARRNADDQGQTLWLSLIGSRQSKSFHPPQIFYSADGWRTQVSSVNLELAEGQIHALRLDGTPGVRGVSLWLFVVKLLVLPAVAAGIGLLLGLEGLNYQIAVLFAALPTASSAYILAMRMGGDGRSVAWLISATTLGSMLTLPLWAAWLSR